MVGIEVRRQFPCKFVKLTFASASGQLWGDAQGRAVEENAAIIAELMPGHELSVRQLTDLFSCLLLSRLELSDTKVYEPYIRALLGSASLCEVAVLKRR